MSNAYQDTSTPAGDPSLADQLRVMRDLREQRQQEQKSKDGEVQSVEAEIAVLSQLSDDIDQIVDTYASTEPTQATLATAQKSYEESTVEKTGLEKIFGPEKIKAIGDAVKMFVDEVARIADEVKNEETNLASLKQQLATAATDRDKAKTVFEMWKKPGASITARHGLLKGIKEDFGKANGKSEFAFAYWLLTSPRKFAGKLKIDPMPISVADLRKKLVEVWKAYDAAIKKFQDLDAKAKGSEKILETKKARLDDLNKKFDASVRSALAPIKPKEG